jgi:hypothetical protein
VLRVSAKTGEGVEALWALVAKRPLRRAAYAVQGQDLLRLAQQSMQTWFEQKRGDDSPLAKIIGDFERGSLSEEEAVDSVRKLWQS